MNAILDEVMIMEKQMDFNHDIILQKLRFDEVESKMEQWRDSQTQGRWAQYYDCEKAINQKKEHQACYLVELVRSVNQHTLRVVNTILASGPVEEQGYKSCDGIIRMAGENGREVMEEACKRALELGRPNYTCIKNLINTAKKEVKDSVPPSDTKHENLRGGWS